MSYQDRKDIDALFDLVWDNNNNQTQFTTREEFEEFKNYIKSNYSMSAFIDALASNMDDNGIVLFENLQDGLNELETNLDGLQDNLTDLSGQLNGDATHTGFINLITDLQHKLYGEGDYDTDNNRPYSYEYPSSSSLKGLLDALRGSLGELSEGDTQLAVTLSDLRSKLVGFSGTLTQFRNQIRQELGDTAYEQLNQDLLELIFNIASTNDQIDDHHQRIQATETLIGSETDSASTQDGTAQNPYTVFGILNDTSDLAGDVNDSANGLIDTLYRGTGNNYNANATPTNPANETTIKRLNQTKSTAERVDGYVGDVSKFTEATISEALKNRADGETAINGKIGNVSYTGNNITSAIASMQTKIGTVNFTGNSISHALNTMQTQIGNVNVNGSLTSVINSLQTNIGNINLLNGDSLSLAIYNSQVNIGDISLFDGGSVSVALQNAQTDIGDVDSSSNGNLQQQIASVINNLIFGDGVGCIVVNTIADRDALNPRLYRTCYVKATGKFYTYTGDDILGG